MYNWWLDLVEVLERRHTLEDNSPGLQHSHITTIYTEATFSPLSLVRFCSASAGSPSHGPLYTPVQCRTLTGWGRERGYQPTVGISRGLHGNTYELESISKTSKSFTIFCKRKWLQLCCYTPPPPSVRFWDIPCDPTSCGCCILSGHV